MKKNAMSALAMALAVLLVLPARASPATPSNASRVRAPATASGWQYDDAVMPASSVGKVENTVNRKDVKVTLRYYDMRNAAKSVSFNLTSSGYFSFSRPSDFASLRDIMFVFSGGSLPSSGKYNFSGDFTSNTGGFTYSEVWVYSSKSSNNVASQFSQQSLNYSQFSGDFYFTTSIDLGNINYLTLNFDFKEGFKFPYGGYASFRFEKLSSGSDVDYNTPGTSDGDKAEDANNTNREIADNTSEMNDTLKEIVQTISNQLAALWNQMYNLMHLPQLANDNRNTDRIVGAIEDNMNVELEQNLEISQDILNNQDDNADKIIDNQNQNTDKLTNGFDNSDMESSNKNLQDSLNGYDVVEDGILDSVTGYITGFSMPDFNVLPPGVVTACIFFGNYLQQLFDGIGSFNFPITLSLTMIFVLMLIGYYRVRG